MRVIRFFPPLPGRRGIRGSSAGPAHIARSKNCVFFTKIVLSVDAQVLASQLTNELRALFPNNAVEYFVSFYDYYLPEAFNSASDTYIDKVGYSRRLAVAEACGVRAIRVADAYTNFIAGTRPCLCPRPRRASATCLSVSRQRSDLFFLGYPNNSNQREGTRRPREAQRVCPAQVMHRKVETLHLAL